ncbi:NAD(P)-binding protein [Komagataeibacter sp. NFXK3]
MKSSDKQLGMGAAISRRDLIHGLAATALGAGMIRAGASHAATPGRVQTDLSNYAGPIADAATYPPVREGMRGAHPGAFEAAHGRRDGAAYPAPVHTGETYDLVVVGGGLSGLAAACFYRRRFGPEARVLVLDNHDDFGGHAKRNEFVSDGRTLMTTGGSAYFVAPDQWTEQARGFVKSLGADFTVKREKTNPFAALGMRPATFLPRASGGDGRLYPHVHFTAPTPEFLKTANLPPRVRQDLAAVYHGTVDYMAGMTTAQKIARLQSITYKQYLLDYVKVAPESLPWLPGVWCLSKTAASAWFAYFRYAPGFSTLGVARAPYSPEAPEDEAADFHMPAGNSDLARLMVRELVPQSLPQGTWQSLETVRLRYDTLDRPNAPARIRLNSIVVRVQHIGDAPVGLFEPDTREVAVDYMRNGKCSRVMAKNVILAGNNNMIPYLCPEMPEEQKAAQHKAVRAANQMTTVLIRNWEAFRKAGTNHIDTPASFFGSFALDVPWAPNDGPPDMDPAKGAIVIFMTGTNSGILNNDTMTHAIMGTDMPDNLTMQQQFRMVRMGLLQTPFAVFERAVRTQMNDALGPYGFDAARDIVGITVNRWPHGFAMAQNSLFDPPSPTGEQPCEIARRQFGRISIANSDASGQDLCNTAIDQAWRAVEEMVPHNYGYYNRI